MYNAGPKAGGNTGVYNAGPKAEKNAKRKKENDNRRAEEKIPKNKRNIQTPNTRQNPSAGDNPEMQEQVKWLSVDQLRSCRLRNI